MAEADIKGFFDHVDHDWLMKMLGHRIADQRVLRMVKRFLKSGVMEDGEMSASEEGVPQGGSLSPVLANIYLHYALDLWFEKVHRKGCRGKARLIRYADDFVVCYEHREDATRFPAALTERLAKFGLEVEPTKTKVLEFGRDAERNARARGERAETFDFLGFTHYCSRTRDGKRFRMKRVTSRKKFRAKLAAFKEWLKRRRNMPTVWILHQVGLKLRGHYAYYGVTDNYRGIARFHREVIELLYKWLNRRSQRRSYSWVGFLELLKRFPLPKPRVHGHLYYRAR
jgi:group II intron reverse transcriptase/maturase